MRKTALGLIAGVAALVGTSAFAADELTVTTETSPLLQQARLVCDSFGRCWHTDRRRVIIDDSYAYAPRRYYSDPYYYDGPRLGVYGPGFSFGFGPRHYW
jgi:hypothetical protein